TPNDACRRSSMHTSGAALRPTAQSWGDSCRMNTQRDHWTARSTWRAVDCGLQTRIGSKPSQKVRTGPAPGRAEQNKNHLVLGKRMHRVPLRLGFMCVLALALCMRIATAAGSYQVE